MDWNTHTSLNHAQRIFKVIHFGGNRKPVFDFIWAVNSHFRSTFNLFGDIAGFVQPEPIFTSPLLLRLKFGDVPFGIDP